MSPERPVGILLLDASTLAKEEENPHADSIGRSLGDKDHFETDRRTSRDPRRGHSFEYDIKAALVKEVNCRCLSMKCI